MIRFADLCVASSRKNRRSGLVFGGAVLLTEGSGTTSYSSLGQRPSPRSGQGIGRAARARSWCSAPSNSEEAAHA